MTAWRHSLYVCLCLALAGCGGDDSGSDSPEPPDGGERLATELVTSASFEDIGDAAVWMNPTTPGEDLLAVALEGDGLALFDHNGQLLQHDPVRAVLGADIRYDIATPDGQRIDLLAVGLPEEGAFGFYRIQPGLNEPLTYLGSLPATIEPESVCLHKNVTTDELSVTGVSGSGRVVQYKLRYDGSGVVSTVMDDTGQPVPVRRFSAGGELSDCVVDDKTATLYVAEEEVGVWAYGAGAEDVKGRRLVDSVYPLGRLQEIEGLDLIYGGAGAGYLVVADEGVGFSVYERGGENAHVTTFQVEGIAEAEALAIGADAFWLGNTEAAEPVYEKLPYSTYNRAVTAAPVTDVLSHRELEVPDVKLVAATAETDEVDDDGDAADDPAFWVHPSDPAKSLVLGTNKQGGLMAYDLSGNEVQYLEGGEPNNVDLRQNVTGSDGQQITLAAASNRELNTIALYRIVEATPDQQPIQRLPAVGNHVHAEAAELVSGVGEVYGLCMYKGFDGTPYVFVNGKDGQVEQWRLRVTQQGVAGEVVRRFRLDSQPEGCVADDHSGKLYLGEEDEGIWTYEAEPLTTADPTRFAAVDGSTLVADVEGLTLYDDGTNKYLIASSQGNNTYVVYDLNNSGSVAGVFAIIGDDERGVDGASDTDGIHVVPGQFGERYPNGIFIAQDWYNVDGEYAPGNQNFKLTSWDEVMQVLGL
ncbi:phytase [Arhodomonas sp. AD133]|uniref:phytase n=1 Tax=Arhodomonas sp. AD133 TaxID=3415009 RepID=UPI003EB7844E